MLCSIVKEEVIDAPPEAHEPGTGSSILSRHRNDRRVAMLHAARELFLERGYAGVALSHVVRRSGGSLATLYDLFGNKAGLLRAVVTDGRDDDLGEIDRYIAEGHPPRAVLRHMAQLFHAKMSAHERIGLVRIVLAESLSDPEFARAFHEQVRVPAIEHLADLLARWTAEGRAAIDRPLDAAEQFFTLVMQNEVGALCCTGAEDRPAPPSIDWRIAPFLSHYRIE